MKKVTNFVVCFVVGLAVMATSTPKVYADMTWTCTNVVQSDSMGGGSQVCISANITGTVSAAISQADKDYIVSQITGSTILSDIKTYSKGAKEMLDGTTNGGRSLAATYDKANAAATSASTAATNATAAKTNTTFNNQSAAYLAYLAQSNAGTASTNATSAKTAADNAKLSADAAKTNTTYNNQSAAYWAYQAAQNGTAEKLPDEIKVIQGQAIDEIVRAEITTTPMSYTGTVTINGVAKTETLTAASTAGQGYTKLTGTLWQTGTRCITLGGKKLLFKVVLAPTTSYSAAVDFSN